MNKSFEDFLKIRTMYDLKRVSRGCSNNYTCEKNGIAHRRKETTAEHIYSCQKLADYFLYTEPEFFSLNKLRVKDLLAYHDDIEIEAGDVHILDDKRNDKTKKEVLLLTSLVSKYPKELEKRLLELDYEFRNRKTPESKFANAIDKMDPLIHELDYPEDWGMKGFEESVVRDKFQPTFEYSITFMEYFENIINYLNKNNYFNKTII